MVNKSIGLDIGFTKIKAVSLNRQKNRYFLNAAIEVPSPPRGMLSEAVLDQEEMAQDLRKAITALKTNTKDVNIALADSLAYTKVIDMPVLSDKELALAIHWEAERHIPVSLANMTLTWSILKKPPPDQSKEKQMQVLIVGAPTNLINKYQKIVSMAGLNLTAIETEILAIIRVLSFPSLPPAIILSIGAISTSLAIVRDGTLVFTYSIPTGRIAITRAIEADFGLTSSQSQEYQKSYGVLGTGVGKKIGKSAEPILQLMVVEVKKALAFYTQKYKDDSIVQQILLSGGTARLPGIDLFFAQNLGIETVVASPWKILGGANAPAEILNSASDFTIATGLAMRDL